MDENVKEQIKNAVDGNKVLLFMKGTPAFPQCGFSNQVVQILRHHEAQFASINVLDDPTVREGIKQYSDWPTIPQLYIDGEFVGGADILMELHTSGELAPMLGGDEEAEAPAEAAETSD